ncbi:MAG TPA: hypothetical protein DDZ83_15165 [Nitrospinae bacterium]|nr:hypothetical protein [Nitrospinota bacterium]
MKKAFLYRNSVFLSTRAEKRRDPLRRHRKWLGAMGGDGRIQALKGGIQPRETGRGAETLTKPDP